MTDKPLYARVPAARGWRWLMGAYALFSRSRLFWLQLILGYWMITIFLTLIPYIGVAVATLLKPVFAVGFLAAAWSQERGERPKLSRLFDAARRHAPIEQAEHSGRSKTTLFAKRLFSMAFIQNVFNVTQNFLAFFIRKRLNFFDNLLLYNLHLLTSVFTF